MAPRTKKQFETIRQRRKVSMVTAAMRLFAESGYQHVSISTIAKEAGVSKGLLYNYFENKEQMVKEIMIEGIHQMMTDLEGVRKQEINRETLINLIDKNFDMMKNDFQYWKLYIAIISQPQVMEMVKEEVMAMLLPFFTLISTYYQAKGVKNPMAYTFLIGSIMDGVALDYLLAPDEYPLDEVRDLIVEKLI